MKKSPGVCPGDASMLFGFVKILYRRHRAFTHHLVVLDILRVRDPAFVNDVAALLFDLRDDSVPDVMKLIPFFFG
jgi:hypothetical protein